MQRYWFVLVLAFLAVLGGARGLRSARALAVCHNGTTPCNDESKPCPDWAVNVVVDGSACLPSCGKLRGYSQDAPCYDGEEPYNRAYDAPYCCIKKPVVLRLERILQPTRCRVGMGPVGVPNGCARLMEWDHTGGAAGYVLTEEGASCMPGGVVPHDECEYAARILTPAEITPQRRIQVIAGGQGSREYRLGEPGSSVCPAGTVSVPQVWCGVHLQPSTKTNHTMPCHTRTPCNARASHGEEDTHGTHCTHPCAMCYHAHCRFAQEIPVRIQRVVRFANPCNHVQPLSVPCSPT